MNERGEPTAVELRGRFEPVRVCNRWSDDAGWWSTPVHRQLFKLLTRSGTLLVVSREESTGNWSIVRVLD